MSIANKYSSHNENTIKEFNNKKEFIENGKINSNTKNIKEKKEFTNPDHELKWNYLIQKSFHMKQDIERIWLLVKNFDLLSMANNKNNYPIVYIKGQDSWKVGNEFKGNMNGDYPFVARVHKNINFPEIKKIEWIFNFINNDNNVYIVLKIELFKVTEDNSTVIVKNIKHNNEKIFNEIEKLMKMSEIKAFKIFEKILENEPINLLKYESSVINGKMEDIWDIVTDFNKLTAIAPNNNFVPNINIKNMKIGEKVETSILFDEELKKFDIYLRIRDERPGWNKWIILLEIYHENKLSHSLLLQLTKINNIECQFSIISKFHEPLKTENFEEISKKEKYLILSVKDFFNNFYSPNS